MDKLGGVWLDVDRRYLNDNQQGGDTYATINLRPGYQKLKGSQALDFVRFRHTDSDLFRLARQQQFVKAIKQAVNHKVTNPSTVPKIFKVLRKNVEIGQGGGAISGTTLLRYAFFVYGLPSGNFFQVKLEGLTGTNDLITDPANIQAAVNEFQNPDTDAPEKATAQVLHRKVRHETRTPSPKNTSVVVLNGNGIAGAAANTSYALGQKGYQVKSPPEGFQANAPGKWGRAFRTQVFYSKAKGASLAAQKMVALFNSADAKPLPTGNSGLLTLSNGAMLTVVVGQNFTGELTPTAPDRTPPREPPNVRSGKAETLPAARAARAWKVGFPLQIPTVIERSSRHRLRGALPRVQAGRQEDRSLHVPNRIERVLGHPGDRLGRCPCARGREPQRGHPGAAVRLLLQRPPPAHGRAPRRRRELLGREHAARLALERDDARDRQGPQALPQVDFRA